MVFVLNKNKKDSKELLFNSAEAIFLERNL